MSTSRRRFQNTPKQELRRLSREELANIEPAEFTADQLKDLILHHTRAEPMSDAKAALMAEYNRHFRSGELALPTVYEHKRVLESSFEPTPTRTPSRRTRSSQAIATPVHTPASQPVQSTLPPRSDYFPSSVAGISSSQESSQSSGMSLASMTESSQKATVISASQESQRSSPFSRKIQTPETPSRVEDKVPGFVSFVEQYQSPAIKLAGEIVRAMSPLRESSPKPATTNIGSPARSFSPKPGALPSFQKANSPVRVSESPLRNSFPVAVEEALVNQEAVQLPSPGVMQANRVKTPSPAGRHPRDDGFHLPSFFSSLASSLLKPSPVILAASAFWVLLMVVYAKRLQVVDNQYGDAYIALVFNCVFGGIFISGLAKSISNAHNAQASSFDLLWGLRHPIQSGIFFLFNNPIILLLTYLEANKPSSGCMCSVLAGLIPSSPLQQAIASVFALYLTYIVGSSYVAYSSWIQGNSSLLDAFNQGEASFRRSYFQLTIFALVNQFFAATPYLLFQSIQHGRLALICPYLAQFGAAQLVVGFSLIFIPALVRARYVYGAKLI
eukprot:TRINITY_DN9595_c0_g1_i1.p1 TRINITY_DN9595_c0_g1~~TRINITY_DN9595_c0_g1_i1.p1  ORF type:complete len:557 (+),score=92.27 TRINITY_DN9595_c0_g1_i1:78-1748(+)